MTPAAPFAVRPSTPGLRPYAQGERNGRTPVVLGLLCALALALGGCGDTLVDHAGVGILSDAATCGDGQVVCGGVCTTQSPAVCGTACGACPAPPANAAPVCTPLGAGGHDGVCGFECAAGLLRCGTGCCAPDLVAAGGEFSCASSTTGAVHCFGAGDVGQLGSGLAVDRATSAEVFGLPAPVTALVAGGAHACARVGAETRCWGDGQAFDAVGSRLTPVVVAALANASALAAGQSHTCGIVAGQVQCVGAGAAAGGGAPSLGGTALEVSAGDHFTCAIVDVGAGRKVKCWGDDTYGQLGRGASGVAPSVPFEVSGVPTTVQHVSAGARHACAGAEARDALWCWGDNAWHQLGDLAPGTYATAQPNARVSKPVLSIAAGGRSTCAVEDDGVASLSCWSADPLLLGLAGGLATGEPVHVASASLAAAPPLRVSTGAAHVCFVDAAASPARLRCFGAGGRGRLGDGRGVDSAAPVMVVDR